MVLTAVAALTGIIIIIQAGSAYAVSSEKVPLVQMQLKIDQAKHVPPNLLDPDERSLDQL